MASTHYCYCADFAVTRITYYDRFFNHQENVLRVRRGGSIMKRAHFICLACENTEVYRPIDSDRPAPTCASCDEAQSGKTEMVWVEDVTRKT
jgi:hypothetical protein